MQWGRRSSLRYGLGEMCGVGQRCGLGKICSTLRDGRSSLRCGQYTMYGFTWKNPSPLTAVEVTYEPYPPKSTLQAVVAAKGKAMSGARVCSVDPPPSCWCAGGGGSQGQG